MTNPTPCHCGNSHYDNLAYDKTLTIVELTDGTDACLSAEAFAMIGVSLNVMMDTGLKAAIDALDKDDPTQMKVITSILLAVTEALKVFSTSRTNAETNAAIVTWSKENLGG